MTSKDFEERIRDVNWTQYERPGFGSIPDALIGLLRACPAQHQSWCSQLERCLLPQATLVQGTPRAIPFVVELVENRVASVCLYSILSYILACTEAGDCGALGTTCRQSVRSGLDIYLRDLQEGGLPDAVRSASLDVICRLTEERATWEPIVRRVHETTSALTLRQEIGNWIRCD